MQLQHRKVGWLRFIQTDYQALEEQHRSRLIRELSLGTLIVALVLAVAVLAIPQRTTLLIPLGASIVVHLVTYLLAWRGAIQHAATLMLIFALGGAAATAFAFSDLLIVSVGFVMPVIIAGVLFSGRVLALSVIGMGACLVALTALPAEPGLVARVLWHISVLLLLLFIARICSAGQRSYGQLVTSIDRAHAQAEEARQQLEQLNHFDPLTGLVNRHYLTSRVAEAIAAAARQGEGVALLYLDLDRFKKVNDTLGHASGDTLLIQAAQRLRGCIRGTDLLARLGGDEFAVLLPDTGEAQATEVAVRILRTFDEPFLVHDHPIQVRTSIGVACAPRDGHDLGALLQHADIAMYQAKAQGGQFRVFNPSVLPKVQEQAQLEDELRAAIAEGQLVLYYQPVCSAVSGELARAEALVRWQHPERGLLPPGMFIPLAEECGLIRSLDRVVLREACRQTAEWVQAGISIPVAFNLSAHSLQDLSLVDYITECLLETGASSEYLTVELTETAAMREPDVVLQVVEGLRELGFRVALDDVGSGYASLTYLRNLPVDVMKIDRSFVQGIHHDQRDEALLRTLLVLGNSLGISVVAEGVEREDQLIWLRDVGYTFVQGYLFGRPMPASEIVQMLPVPPDTPRGR